MSGGVFAIIGLGVVAAVIAVVLRQAKPEYAALVSLAAGIFIIYMILNDLTPVVSEIETIIQTAAMPVEYAQVMFKSLGVCMLTQIACDTCRDSGETAIATKIEMAGRISILAISLPLFTQVLSIVSSLMS